MSRIDVLGNILRWIFGRPRPNPPPVPQPTPIGPPAPVPPPSDQTTATALFAAINSARTANGVPALANDREVGQIAELWAAHMARYGILDHGNLSDRIASVRPGMAAGETIGEGYLDVGSEVRGWLNSPAHRSIMLSGTYRSVGCGVARGSDGSLWYVADFCS